MSQKAGLSFGLGVSLGVGSYFASRGLPQQVPALENIKNHISALQNVGIPISIDVARNIHFGGTVEAVHNQFAAARGAYRDEVYSKSRYGPVYDFGELVGLAEGQASAGADADAQELAWAAMKQAKAKASALGEYGISPGDVPLTHSYDQILELRKGWQTRFTNSAAF